MIDDKKVTDHHAIMPTDKKPDYKALNDDENPEKLAANSPSISPPN